MKTLIPIDRTTIVKNRDVGSQTTYYPGMVNASFRCDKPHDLLINDGRYLITSYVIPDGEVSGEIVCPVTEEIIKELKSINADVSVSNNMLRIDHLPIPEYDYSYVNVPLKCKHCGSKFMYTELQSDEFEGSYSSTVCPICSEWDCVKIKHEKIEKVIEEMTKEQINNIPYNNER